MTSQPSPRRIVVYILTYAVFAFTFMAVGGRALSTFH